MSCFLLLSCLCFAVGCRTPTNKSEFERGVLQTDSSEAALRMANISYVGFFARRVEATADAIMEESSDPDVRRQALLWKISFVTAGLSALDHPSPVGGLLDSWAVTAQMHEYLKTGAGRHLFGDLQPQAVAACAELEARVVSIAANHFRAAQFTEIRELMTDWVKEYPIQDIAFERPSGQQDLARELSQRIDSDVFTTVKNLETELQLLRATLGLQVAFLPRQARWQAELLMASAVENQIPPLMNQAFAQLVRERATVLEDLNRQRMETQEFVREERQQLVNAITNERIMAIHSIETLVQDTTRNLELLVEQQRTTSLQEVDRQRVETVRILQEERVDIIREIDRLADEVVDTVYSRIWLVLGAIWVGIAALIVLVRWLFGGRKAA